MSHTSSVYFIVFWIIFWILVGTKVIFFESVVATMLLIRVILMRKSVLLVVGKPTHLFKAYLRLEILQAN